MINHRRPALEGLGSTHNPNLVPLLHAIEFVMKKLYGRVDLTTLGLANDLPFQTCGVTSWD